MKNTIPRCMSELQYEISRSVSHNITRIKIKIKLFWRLYKETKAKQKSGKVHSLLSTKYSHYAKWPWNKLLKRARRFLVLILILTERYIYAKNSTRLISMTGTTPSVRQSLTIIANAIKLEDKATVQAVILKSEIWLM